MPALRAGLAKTFTILCASLTVGFQSLNHPVTQPPNHKITQSPDRQIGKSPDPLGTWDPRKFLRHDSCAFFYSDDFIDRDVGELIDGPAWPSDFKQADLCPLSESEKDSAVLRGPITHSAF